jgi:hypothetical protein
MNFRFFNKKKYWSWIEEATMHHYTIPYMIMYPPQPTQYIMRPYRPMRPRPHPQPQARYIITRSPQYIMRQIEEMSHHHNKRRAVKKMEHLVEQVECGCKKNPDSESWAEARLRMQRKLRSMNRKRRHSYDEDMDW